MSKIIRVSFYDKIGRITKRYFVLCIVIIILFCAFYILFPSDLWKFTVQIVWWVFVSNYLIALLSSWLHYHHGNKENLDTSVTAEIAGLLEEFFYVFLLIFEAHFLLAGYLVLKAIGLYQADRRNKKAIPPNKQEGESLVALRIGVVLSLLFSIVISAFFLPAIKDFPIYKKIHSIFAPNKL